MKIRQINICPEELKYFCQLLYVSRLLSFLENAFWSWLFQQVRIQYNAARPSACLNINLLFGYNLIPSHNFIGKNYNTQMDGLSKDDVSGNAFGNMYYRAPLIGQVCNRRNNNSKMICFYSYILAIVFLKRKVFLKTNLDNLNFNPDDTSTIYRLTDEISTDQDGSFKFTVYSEDFNVSAIPFDDAFYLVPAVFTDMKNNKLRGLTGFEPLFSRIVVSMNFKINADGSLSSLENCKGFDSKNGFYTDLLINPDGWGEEIEAAAASLPAQINWADFYSEEAFQNVGFAFELVDSSPIDMDLDAFRMQKELAGEIDGEDDTELTGIFVPDYLLHKVFLSSLPKVGSLYYLPAEINFNEKQQRKGYAFFDATKQVVLDLHFYDKNNGQVSAMSNTEMLENCGIFKDESKFSYKILLSNI